MARTCAPASGSQGAAADSPATWLASAPSVVATSKYLPRPMYDQLHGAPSREGTEAPVGGTLLPVDKRQALRGRLAKTAQHTSCNVYGMARFSPSPTIGTSYRAQLWGPIIGIGCLAAAKRTVVEEPPRERAAVIAWDEWARPRCGSTALLLRWVKSESPGWACGLRAGPVLSGLAG